ncbi:MAG: hypothetical protein N2691_04070 [Patescibacteria group bacterium]|nr:hypothetical protein [Patescibacteria group bacterium]
MQSRNILIHSNRATAFTIIELLVVIAVIALLAVTLLTLLNPVEAQKRNRDSKRLKDANTLQAVLNQYLEDGHSFGSACTTAIPCTSEIVPSGVSYTPCANTSENWMGGTNVTASLCQYIQSVPVDPVNTTTDVVDDASPGDIKSDIAVYRFAVSGRNYEINVRQESITNLSKVTGDAGNSAEWFEVSNTQGMTLP